MDLDVNQGYSRQWSVEWEWVGKGGVGGSQGGGVSISIILLNNTAFYSIVCIIMIYR